MKKKTLILALLLLVFSTSTYAWNDHEYGNFKKGKFKYKNWDYKEINTGEKLDLREFSKGKKQVLVFYFAPWCENSRFEIKVLNELHKKYSDKGLAIIGVSLYASKKKAQQFAEVYELKFPVVAESFSEKDRKKTLHYKYRKKMKDKRKWGTPFNVFLTPSQLEQEGEYLTKTPTIVAGEIRLGDAEIYLKRFFPNQ